MSPALRRHGDRSEAGFTLVEALVSMVILSFGLMAVSNLFLVGGTSNKAANHGTAATAQAVEVMERLKSLPFTTLAAATGGSLGANQGTLTTSNTACGLDGSCCAEPTTSANCVVAGNYNMVRNIAGVGRIRVRWQIVAPGAGGTDTIYIVVRAESTAPIVGGARSRAEMTTFRACTLSGCPF
jgi:type IV pilus modification protein PilV